LAWTNLGGPVRILSHRWKGMLKDSEKDEVRVHPTQKPVALMARIIELFTQPGDLVVDPYMGSGPTGVAAMRLGRRFAGCEIEPAYFATAERRIAQAAAQLRLF
jgi:DNA modification methylase